MVSMEVSMAVSVVPVFVEPPVALAEVTVVFPMAVLVLVVVVDLVCHGSHSSGEFFILSSVSMR